MTRQKAPQGRVLLILTPEERAALRKAVSDAVVEALEPIMRRLLSLQRELEERQAKDGTGR